MSRKHQTSLPPPFLRHISTIIPPDADRAQYPLSLPLFRQGGIDVELTRKVTIIVGDNGIGKSTLLEGVAAQCGFSLIGGNRNHVNYDTEKAVLAKFLRLGWKPKVSSGFFLRAETMFSFMRSIDEIARESNSGIYAAYGGKSLNERSHGEAFLSVFENRFGSQGIYILDEPEAALSPARQIDFLRLLRKLDEGNACQIIIATHSVLVMAYPGAQLLRLSHEGIREVEFHQMPHFKILRDFCADPDAFLAGVYLDD